MTVSQIKIGFVGLGLMGAPMAENLLEAGAQLTLFNRTATKCTPLVKLGATVAGSPSDLAMRTAGGIIILCVSDTPAFEAAITGPHGVLSGLSPDTLIIDMGSSKVGATRRLAKLVEQAGGRFVDAPVSGGEIGAQSGTLSIMVGGAETDIIRAMPIFDILGKSLTHIGPTGTGQAAKAANQIIVGGTVSIIAESLLLAQAAGADITRVREALMGGFAGSRILELHGQRMIDQAFEPGAHAKTQLKDMHQAVGLAKELELSLPFLNKNSELWSEMVDAGYGDIDQSGYFEFVRSKQTSISQD